MVLCTATQGSGLPGAWLHPALRKQKQQIVCRSFRTEGFEDIVHGTAKLRLNPENILMENVGRGPGKRVGDKLIRNNLFSGNKKKKGWLLRRPKNFTSGPSLNIQLIKFIAEGLISLSLGKNFSTSHFIVHHVYLISFVIVVIIYCYCNYLAGGLLFSS